jgi:tRNA/rRNA methyltransferase
VVGTTAIGHRQLRHPLRRLEYGAREIRECKSTVALLFGSEKFGLSNEDMSHCDWLMHIPTRDQHQSMNLGQAVAVCLYELIRSDEAADAEPKRRETATVADRELFTTALLELLNESGYVNPLTAESTVAKIRRLVTRLNLAAADVQIWMGIIRQIRWQLGQAGRTGEASPRPPEH